MIGDLEGYPFDQQTERFIRRQPSAATGKLFMDAFQGVLPRTGFDAEQGPVSSMPEVQAAGFEALHYEIDGPHRMVSTTQGQGWRMPPEMLSDGEPHAERSVRTVGCARSRCRIAAGHQPRQREALGSRLVPDLAELRDPDLGTGLVPHVSLTGRPPITRMCSRAISISSRPRTRAERLRRGRWPW